MKVEELISFLGVKTVPINAPGWYWEPESSNFMTAGFEEEGSEVPSVMLLLLYSTLFLNFSYDGEMYLLWVNLKGETVSIFVLDQEKYKY